MSTCRTPISEEKGLFFIKSTQASPVYLAVSDWRVENDVASPKGGTKENAQTCVTQAPSWVLSNLSIIKVL